MQALNDYPGAVILISHDRYLVEACVDRLWLVADGTVKPFDGDMEDYKRLVLWAPHLGEADKSAPTGRRRRRSASPAERKAARRCGRRERIKALEAAMEKLTAIIADIDEKLARPGLFQRAPEQGARDDAGARDGGREAGPGRGGLARGERRRRSGLDAT